MKASFECVDGHTAGMPVRMVVSGAPKLQGADQSERRQHFIQEFDWIRRESIEFDNTKDPKM